MTTKRAQANNQLSSYEVKQRELDTRLRNLVVKERTLLADIIALLKEIDRRRVYLELGYPSLFEYLVKGVGYSEGAAQRRIDAARLMADVPELHERIMCGNIKLNQAVMVQKAAREVMRLQSRVVHAEEKRRILEKLRGQTHADSQRTVAMMLGLSGVYGSRQTTQADGSVRIEVTLSREAYEKMVRVREELSHVVPTGDVGQLIEYLVDRASRKTRKKSAKSARVVGDDHLVPTAKVAVSTSTKREIHRRDQSCQYIDPITKRRCGGRWALQIDHIQPRFRGGNSSFSNLQILCAKHNRLKYLKDRIATQERTLNDDENGSPN